MYLSEFLYQEASGMNYKELDTPALIIDREKMIDNLHFMQDYADRQGVALRPHTKTHKMPAIAKLQEQLGAKGITVAKVGEAEVMAQNGLQDIFIANEIVGKQKLERIRALGRSGITISFAVDTPCQVEAAEEVFAQEENPARLLIEIEVGENRSGIIHEADFTALLETIRRCAHVEFAGIFSHEGHCYNAETVEDCREKFIISQERTLSFARLARELGMVPQVVSIGSTPSLMHGFDILPGITEIRPGTYVLMDASQGHAIGTLDRCAATVLTTVISRPTAERVITDVGAKGLTAQTRQKGICATPGLGTVKGFENVHIFDVYDEHAIIYDKSFRDGVRVGDKVEFYPVHICPVCNLYEKAALVSNGDVVEEIPILCRGRLQ